MMFVLVMRSLGLAWVGIVVGACAFDHMPLVPGNGVEDAGRVDMFAGGDVDVPDVSMDPPDAAVDAGPCPGWPYDPTNFNPCAPEQPPLGMGLFSAGADWTYNTDTGVLNADGMTSIPSSALVMQLGGGPQVRLLHIAGLDLGSGDTLIVTGTRSLIIAVSGSAQIAGDIEVQTSGATGTLCSSGDGEPGAPSGGAAAGGGGGGGGAYGTNGGDAGDGNGGGHGNGGGKGTPEDDATISPLRGGCAGGQGGTGFGGTGLGGAAGVGGGALQISVRDDLQVSGRIAARGRRGRGGVDIATVGFAGGGGAGSGGAILLEGDVVTVTSAAELCANGGSGGEGASTTETGADGEDGTCSETNRATTPDTVTGGNGGLGSTAGDVNGGNGSNGTAGGGGGGGGGGLGRIRVRAMDLTVDAAATISPAAAM